MASYPYGQSESLEENPLDFDDDEGRPQSRVSDELEPLPPPENVNASGTSRTLSVVGRTLVFKGELSAEEDLLIQGSVQGSITHTGNNLTIGAHSSVKADIRGRKLIVQGEVQGDMWASESVTVEASARVTGNIIAPRVGIKEGAKFKGSIDMDVGQESSSETTGRKGRSTRATRNATQKEDDTLNETGVDRLLA